MASGLFLIAARQAAGPAADTPGLGPLVDNGNLSNRLAAILQGLTRLLAAGKWLAATRLTMPGRR
jgi:hypothetical protein